jgi:uncharacterized protein
MNQSRMSIKIVLKQIKKEDLKDTIFVTGFRTFGEVGYISVRHVIKTLHMQRVGFIYTKHIRDLVFLDDYGIAAPHELFYDKNNNLLVLLNHILPMHKEWGVFAGGITSWLIENGIREAFYIGGLDRSFKVGNERVRWLSTSNMKRKINAPLMNKGLYIVGPLALLLLNAEIEGFPAAVILPYADRDRPDPAAAAAAVELLGETINISIDTKKLYDEAKIIEEEVSKQLEILSRNLNKASGDRVYM